MAIAISQMVLYLFNQILMHKKNPENIIDPNLKTSYERLHILAENKKNREVLLDIIKNAGIAGNIHETFSLDNLKNEKYIKVMMLSSLFFNRLYNPVSEQENINGYTDIYLEKKANKRDINYEFVFEIKYIKKEDAAKDEIESKFTEAIAQIKKYKKDKRFIGRSDIKFAAFVFWGKSNYEIKEV